VRPESYIEINNFYTATVYEKGAEVIRMLRLLVGDEGL
jgi:aminopeptidase N